MVLAVQRRNSRADKERVTKKKEKRKQQKEKSKNTKERTKRKTEPKWFRFLIWQ
jgi:hypothetical protein